jgi:hypothetical protein
LLEATAITDDAWGVKILATQENPRAFRLADVLLAMEKYFQFDGGFAELSAKYQLVEETTHPSGRVIHQPCWDFSKDDLTEQSDECLEFIANQV